MSRHHKPDYDEIRRLEHELGFDQEPENPPPPPPRRDVSAEEHRISKGLREAAPYASHLTLSSVSSKQQWDESLFYGPKLRTVIYGPNGKPL